MGRKLRTVLLKEVAEKQIGCTIACDGAVRSLENSEMHFNIINNNVKRNERVRHIDNI